MACGPHGRRRFDGFALEDLGEVGKLLTGRQPPRAWNEFDGLALEAQKLRLRLYAMEGRTYTTVAEVQVWGAAQ